MPETKTTARRPVTNGASTKAAPARKTRAAETQHDAKTEHDAKAAIVRTTELTDDVLKSLEEGAQNAIEAVRKFVETVDKALPTGGDGPSRREEITDSALEMAERLVHAQSDFLQGRAKCG
jgi:uncharacterized hydantoinase/oxoprolinase family protein